MRSGVAPVLLLDVQTPSGDIHYWSDRALVNIPAAITADGDPALVTYLPWLLSPVTLTFNRSLQTDTGAIDVQNLSGNVLQRDFESIVRRGVLEGSLFVLRYYSVDMEWTWLEQHGTLSVGETGLIAPLSLQQLLAGADDTPAMNVSETCQLVWGKARSGATGSTEFLYTFFGCQEIEHFTGIQTGFEINNPESVASLPTQTINRKRAW